MTNLENQLQCAAEFVFKALKDLFFVLIVSITAENMSCIHIKVARVDSPSANRKWLSPVVLSCYLLKLAQIWQADGKNAILS